jgi:gliding motility-associated-like protein
MPFTWNGQAVTGAGTYTLTATGSAGCDSTTNLNVALASIITVDIDTTVCTNAVPFTWNGRAVTGAGTYTFTTTGSAGCDSTTNLNVALASVITVDIDTTVCANAVPFTWNGQTVTGVGTYTFPTTGSTGCDSTTTLHVAISSLNLFISDPTTTCSPNTIDLTDPSVTAGSDVGLNYTYWTDAAATTPLGNPTAITTSGTYYIKATSAAGCTVIKPVTVTINTGPAPNVSVTDPAAVCEPATVDLTNPNITAGSDNGLNYTYWMDAANTVPLPNPNAVGQSGTYYITGTATGGCSSTSSVQVTVKVTKAPPGITYPSVSTAPNTSVQLSARELGFGYTYQWFPPVGINFDDIKNPTFNYNKPTQYTITLTPADGSCPTVDTLLVMVRPQDLGCKSKIDVPKAWSPNNDGHNDKLYPLTLCIKELKYFRVFDRWGQLMFETSTIGNGWDGLFKGSPQVMDVYTWTLEATGVDGVHYKLAGNSILLR